MRIASVFHEKHETHRMAIYWNLLEDNEQLKQTTATIEVKWQ